MAKGFLSGAVLGTAVSVVGLGTLSVLEQNEAEQRDALAEAVRELTEQPVSQNASVSEGSEQASETADVDEPVTEEVAEGETETSENLTEDPTPEVAPASSEQEAVELSAQGEADGSDAQIDETAAPVASEAQQSEPEAADETAEAPQPEMFEPVETVSPGEVTQPATAPEDVTSVAPETTAPVLETPDADIRNDAGDVFASPSPAPQAEDTVAALTEPETSNVPDTPTQISPASPSVPSSTLPTPEPEIGVDVVTEPADEPPEAAPPVQQTEAENEADTETASVETPPRPQVRQLVPATPTPDVADGDVETAALARPQIGRPAGSLINRDGQSASRLPTIGNTSEAPDAEDASDTTTSDAPPLERFAASVDVADPNLPRRAVVLLDDGTGPLGPDTIDNFPFPVTFVLDPLMSDVGDRMAGYRSKGYEVATLADLPEGVQPTDDEQILAGALAAVPESVALVEAPGGGLQFERASTEQTAAFVAESGHGLVLLPNGLNTAEAIARRENVPAVSVLRDFDGDGQDARTKRRFLDGAAFRARQDGNVVMLGRLTADTVSALLLWSLQDRASSVTMVPVSAILKASLN